MSEVDRRPGGVRVRRLLTRALVVAGATVAGTSAACLLACGTADAEPTSASLADSSAVDVDGAVSALLPSDVDAPSSPVGKHVTGVLVPVERVISEGRPVTQPVRDVVEPIASRVPDEESLLPEPAADEPATPEPDDEVPPQPGAPQSTSAGSAQVPDSLERPDVSFPRVAASPVPETSSGGGSAETAVTEHRQSTEDEAVPVRRPGGPALPSPARSTGTGATDTSTSGKTAGIAWYSEISDDSTKIILTPIGAAAHSPAGAPAPQPGTTPD